MYQEHAARGKCPPTIPTCPSTLPIYLPTRPPLHLSRLPITPPSTVCPESQAQPPLVAQRKHPPTTTMAAAGKAPIRLGSEAQDFEAETSVGPINFHQWAGDSWVILFSHPQDYTPVCTTELGAFAKLEPEFTKRGVKLIGLSADTTERHEGWIKDIAEVTGGNVKFPIIADSDRKVASLYDM